MARFFGFCIMTLVLGSSLGCGLFPGDRVPPAPNQALDMLVGTWEPEEDSPDEFSLSIHPDGIVVFQENGEARGIQCQAFPHHIELRVRARREGESFDMDALILPTSDDSMLMFITEPEKPGEPLAMVQKHIRKNAKPLL